MKNLILLLFVILSIPVTAQNHFTPGYIITAEGDTIQGLIYEMADAEMSRKLNFKTAEDGEIQKFTVKNLVGFGFDSGRKFERRTLLPKPGKDEDTTYVFAKNLLRGEIDVFVARHFQKRNPDIFLDNNSENTSIQIFRSVGTDALNVKEFLKTFVDDPQTLPNPAVVKFREKRFLKYISTHNETLSGRFPDTVYRENIEYDWDFIVGIPVDYSNDALHFRGGIYFNKMKIERTSNFSALFGIFYHHRELKDMVIQNNLNEGELNIKWQLLNMMPLAIKFQGNSGNLRPYGYIGAGAALLRETNITIGVGTTAGEDIRWKLFPTINSGIGVRIRIGEQYLITELTPTINNVFLNLGLSI